MHDLAVTLARQQLEVSHDASLHTVCYLVVMTTGTWFVLCDPSRAITLSDLADRLKRLKNSTPRYENGTLVVVAHDPNGDADVDVALSTASHVIVEAQEIAERHGRPELATLAGRYELLFDIAKSDLVYNTLARISGELETVCGGVIYAANDGRFV